MAKDFRIFLCEDDPAVSKVTRLILEKNSYKVHSCDDGDKALEEIKKVKPHLIIMDISICGLTGDAITLILKQEQETKHIPVLLFSTLNSGEEMAKKVNADAFLRKPFNIEELENIVSHLLVKSSLSQNIQDEI